MRKLIATVWMSLDGVFDAESMGEWFFPFDSIERQVYITNGILNTDTVVLGRVTYDLLSSFWPNQRQSIDNSGPPVDKINSVEKYVISSTLKKAEWQNTRIISKDLIERINKLKNESGNEIQIWGSSTLVKYLMNENLIDEYRILVHPKIMGTGKKYFQEGMSSIHLNLLESKTLTNGVKPLHYLVSKN